MARYTADSKERVRDAVDMVDLVGARTELRRAGADRYTGLCPFHDERTPSFSVKPSEKVYYCFGCQAAGDAFTFAQETEGLDFVGAIEFLADRYGVTLELEAEDPQAAARAPAARAAARAARPHVRLLRARASGTRARARGPASTCSGRGLEEAILREFRVGYAPSAWDRVLLGLARRRLHRGRALDAGLVQRSRERPGSVYDRFRARIIFPLCDNRGRVLGFGGAGDEPRAAGQVPQHAPTARSTTRVATSSGSHLARTAAAKAGSAIVCEGYTDVIAAHQAGLRNCVGLMGTALTEEQVGELRRLAPTVVLALDADGAGQEAMLKAARLGREAPPRAARRWRSRPGSDPAEVLQRATGRGRAGRPARRVGAFVRFRVERILAGGDLGTRRGARPDAGRARRRCSPTSARGRCGSSSSGRSSAALELPERTVARLLRRRSDGRRGRAGGDPGRIRPRRARAHRAGIPRAVHRAARRAAGRRSPSSTSTASSPAS